MTITIVDWLDIFMRPAYKHIIVDSLNYCIDNKGLQVYCWCLMSNHLHLIASASEGNNLSDILRDFKKFTSKDLIRSIKETPESRRDWLLNLFWYAGKNDKKIKYRICLILLDCKSNICEARIANPHQQGAIF
jgi:putative transposase